MAMQKIFAREILDSRGNPTVEVDLHTAKGNTGPLYWFASENPRPHLLLPKSPISCPLSTPSQTLFSSWPRSWGRREFLFIFSCPWVQGGDPRPL